MQTPVVFKNHDGRVQVILGTGQVKGGRVTRWGLRCNQCGGWLTHTAQNKSQATRWAREHATKGHPE